MVDFVTPENDLINVDDLVPMLTVTQSAAATIKTLLEQRNIPSHVLRVFVQGGGCSGMQYGMTFEAAPEVYDEVVEVDGVRLVVDPTSIEYLRGATIDFVDSLMGGGFRIDNPTAVSSCGCGSSFRTSDSSGGSTGGCGTCGSH